MKNNMRRTITLAPSATALSTVLAALALLSPAEATEQARAGVERLLG